MAKNQDEKTYLSKCPKIKMRNYPLLNKSVSVLKKQLI